MILLNLPPAWARVFSFALCRFPTRRFFRFSRSLSLKAGYLNCSPNSSITRGTSFCKHRAENLTLYLSLEKLKLAPTDSSFSLISNLLCLVVPSSSISAVNSATALFVSGLNSSPPNILPVIVTTSCTGVFMVLSFSPPAGLEVTVWLAIENNGCEPLLDLRFSLTAPCSAKFSGL